jgi:uncharacterized RDD family membrane protein YckC
MNSIKLLNWSNSDKKIPSYVLAPLKPKKKSIAPRILASLLIDQGVVFFSGLIFKVLIQEQIRFYLNNSILKISQKSNFHLEMIGMGVIFFLYSYLSFILNQGQTLGMKLGRIRANVDKTAFSSYFKLSLKYCLINFTYGLSLKNKKLKNFFLEHDHLYYSLIEYKDDSRFKLIEEIRDEKLSSIQKSNKAA